MVLSLQEVTDRLKGVNNLWSTSVSMNFKNKYKKYYTRIIFQGTICDRVQINMSTFSTQDIISVNLKVTGQLYQPNYHSFSY